MRVVFVKVGTIIVLCISFGKYSLVWNGINYANVGGALSWLKVKNCLSGSSA